MQSKTIENSAIQNIDWDDSEIISQVAIGDVYCIYVSTFTSGCDYLFILEGVSHINDYTLFRSIWNIEFSEQSLRIIQNQFTNSLKNEIKYTHLKILELEKTEYKSPSESLKVIHNLLQH